MPVRADGGALDPFERPEAPEDARQQLGYQQGSLRCSELVHVHGELKEGLRTAVGRGGIGRSNWLRILGDTGRESSE